MELDICLLVMKNKFIYRKKPSILVKIFSIILIFSLSIILFLLAFWGLITNTPSQLYSHVHLAITLIILIFAGFLLTSFLIKKILKPLSILNEAVENAGKGNFNQNITINSNDEFGRLAATFNKMTADLKQMTTAREQLLLDISHELRTPITRAKLALEMMQESSERTSIAEDLNDMEAMVSEILESARLQKSSEKIIFTTIKIPHILNQLKKQYEREAERIIIYPVNAELSIHINEIMILTVLKNIINNSLKYSHLGGKPIEIRVIKQPEKIIINIEDFGKGIPADKIPFVFEPFYRVDQSRSKQSGGYGLGLHICKRIMDIHNAELKIINKDEGIGIITSLIFSAL